MDIERIVDECRAKNKGSYNAALSRGLFPSMFDDDRAWARVQSILEAHDNFTRKYVIAALQEILSELDLD